MAIKNMKKEKIMKAFSAKEEAIKLISYKDGSVMIEGNGGIEELFNMMNSCAIALQKLTGASIEIIAETLVDGHKAKKTKPSYCEIGKVKK